MVSCSELRKQVKIKDYKDLKIWQKGIEISDKIYSVTESFPKTELYGLTSQMRRSAISIPSNIAEGFRRYHNKEYRQFLYIALGSCAELEAQIIIANKLDYINETNKTEFIEKIKYICRMTVKLINKL